ncbi:MAG TPA: cytochrome P450 [Gemmatimonadaceae bacterium]|nr:cytochrome P450 [Gemmatimonadaceae bacterium]
MPGRFADKRSPPGPRARFPGHMMLQFLRRRLPFMIESAEKYGDIVLFKVGNERVHLFNHPDLIRDVLVTNQKNFVKSRALVRAKRLLGEGLLTSEGEFHLRQRRLTQPAFHRDRVAAYGRSMVDYAVQASSRWVSAESLDVHDEMMKLTLAIVARTLFSTDVESEAIEIGDALTISFESFNVATLPFSEILEKLPLPYTRRFEAARARLDATIYRIIEERRSSGRDEGDLLSMLLLTQDTEGDGGGMTNAQLRDEAMTIFLAGHETTANALSWTWYLLSRHPDVEARFHREVDALGARSPQPEDLPSLPYTRMILAESMRLYPPAWAIGRRALNDFEANGYLIPARSMVLMSQYITHRDPRFYPDPERFDPERWRPEVAATRPKFSYFPFGGGTRICIGEQFAWMEGILILAAIGRHWRMLYLDESPPAIEPRITLRPKSPLIMQVEPR